ncbi:MAG: hypothetical protein R3335_02475 [Anaerolineales bacterium]|nr:hypothetical protein [Anaerolineales bacterium]
MDRATRARRRAYLTVLLVIVTALLAAGCQAIAPQATPTAAPSSTPEPTNTLTPEPTSTPEATATTVPTDTPTPTASPTSTPDLTSTAAVEATEMAIALIAEIEEELQVAGYSTSDGHLAYSSNDPVNLAVVTYGDSRAEMIADGGHFENFAMAVDVTWNSTSGLAGCGFMVRADDDLERGAHYRLYTIRLSGFPGWDLEYWKFGNWQSTLTAGGRVLTSQASNQDQGGTNRYLLIGDENELTVFANEERLGKVPINTLAEGQLGFFVFHESGETSCEFNNAYVWSYDE